MTDLSAPMLSDLSGRADVHDLVVEFYREVIFDDVLGPVFEEVAEVRWDEHIPRLVDYWCRILFGDLDHRGSLTVAHRHLHQVMPIRAEHCDRWYGRWTECLDGRWRGPNADRARHHAAVLLTGMATHVFGIEWSPG
jgi:hemoglobin